MIADIYYNNQKYKIDLNQAIDISIPIDPLGVVAWGIDRLRIEPVKNGEWEGSVSMGAAVNFNNISFNPHAHSTHTECVGHISVNNESLNNELKQYFFLSKLITVCPRENKGDYIITKKMIQQLVKREEKIEALIIRTLPNHSSKKKHNYSNTNPPYLSKGAAQYMVDINVRHLLIDTPSIDKEKDDGQVVAHKTFWQFPESNRTGCTITELIYVPDSIVDDLYFLNLQFVAFENDASPSRPILFKVISYE